MFYNFAIQCSQNCNYFGYTFTGSENSKRSEWNSVTQDLERAADLMETEPEVVDLLITFAKAAIVSER